MGVLKVRLFDHETFRVLLQCVGNNRETELVVFAFVLLGVFL